MEIGKKELEGRGVVQRLLRLAGCCDVHRIRLTQNTVIIASCEASQWRNGVGSLEHEEEGEKNRGETKEEEALERHAKRGGHTKRERARDGGDQHG